MRIINASPVLAELQSVIGAGQNVAMKLALVRWRKTVRTDIGQRNYSAILLAIKDQFPPKQGEPERLAPDLTSPSRTIPCIFQKALWDILSPLLFAVSRCKIGG